MKAIIPTGGRGTRMQPLTFSKNKHFIPIANKPLIYYPIETIVDAGITDIAITYNPGWLETVKEFLGDGSKWGVKFTFVCQEKPLGLANIFEVCEKFVGDDKFLLHLGDNIFADGIKDLVEYFEKEDVQGMVAMMKHPENWRLGVPIFDNQGRLIDYIEKPKNPPNEFAIPGLYFFNPVVYKCFSGLDKIKASARGEYEITGPFKWLIKKGYRVDVKEYKGKWLDPGKFDDWINANQYILDTQLQSNCTPDDFKDSKIEGRFSVGKNCVIENSEIRGPVIIGNNVEIRDCYIGPYTSISDSSKITNSHVENSVVMDSVVITNVKQPINESLIGSEAEVFKNASPTECLKLFIGDKSQVKL